jgi:hypothetical protein
MTELRSDSLIKLRKLIVDVRSGRKNENTYWGNFFYLRYPILENIDGVRQWFSEKRKQGLFFGGRWSPLLLFISEEYAVLRKWVFG